MTIKELEWDNLRPFLRKARKQGELSLKNHKSHFKILQTWFEDKEFNQINFSSYLAQIEESGKSASYENNAIKFVKHLSYYLGIPEEFRDFKYVAERTTKEKFTLTNQQIEKLAEAVIPYAHFKDRKQKHRALIYFLGHIGSRIEETLLLEWRDIIDGDVPMIHFREETTKTKRERFCPIPRFLLDMIRELPQTDARIFPKIDQSNFRVDLKKRCKKIGLDKNVTCHTFRDSSINNKLSYGVPIQEVASYHGHVNIATTYKYYAIIEAQKIAQTFYHLDPTFQQDQTFEMFIKARVEETEKKLNPRVSNYKKEIIVNEFNKKEYIFRFVER